MQSTTLEELRWLHDSDVLSILYDTSGNDCSIRLTMHCPTDSGHALWEGKRLVLVAIDVAGSKHIVFGVTGPETFDRIKPGVSAMLRENTMKGRSFDTRFNFEFTITFVSGSALEVICQEIQVEAKP